MNTAAPSMQPDVLCITVPLESNAYPSTNGLGANSYRGGRKSPAYRTLFRDVKKAAETERARIGWPTATYPCTVSLTLYRNDLCAADSGNLSKCEHDALTAAGVWEDDRLAVPCTFAIEYDPEGVPRVNIVVRRRFPTLADRLALRDRDNASTAAAKPRTKARTRRKASTNESPAATMPSSASVSVPRGRYAVGDALPAGEPIPNGMALISGRLVRHADAHAAIATGKIR
jgi:hypothetical protein